MTMEQKLIIGNWKMNKKYNDVYLFFSTFNRLIKHDKIIKKLPISYAICPTYLAILPALSLAKAKTTIMAQDVSFESSGAFTSQIACSQLAEYNVNYSLVGHSETRAYLAVTDEIVNLKVIKLLENRMTPIICIGETKKAYDDKKTLSVLKKQLDITYKDVTALQAINTIIAYEPIWAIGTATTPSYEQINTNLSYIRKHLALMYDQKVADGIMLLYGGSVSIKNAKDILNIDELNGLLVGKASLDPTEFYEIIKACPTYQTKVNSLKNKVK